MFIVPLQLFSQTLPKEGSTLNYRLIGFSFPADRSAKKYKVEIAVGSFFTEDSFQRKIVHSQEYKSNKIIILVPSFGTQYTWRVVSADGSKAKGQLHHFSTMSCPEVDTAITRLSILTGPETYKDAYVFLDGNGVLYDMYGQPVWFLPYEHGDPQQPRDMRATDRGTITFLAKGEIPREINYNGDVLWRAPDIAFVSGEASEGYHHEFARLANGHYMVLGTESVRFDTVASSPQRTSASDTALPLIRLGTILEYNEKGALVWSWRSSNYFKDADLKYWKKRDEIRISNKRDRHRTDIDVHENAFYFDQKDSIIYIGFRNISRIIKVKYPEGYVMNTYGEIYRPGVTQTGNNLFCGQHDMGVSQKGHLYVFNNRSCKDDGVPRVTVLQEGGPGENSPKKIWEYQCTLDPLSAYNKEKAVPNGGSICELPDQSFLVCMVGIFNKIFIVNADKQVLWSALSERFDSTLKKWEGITQYRASIITDSKALEKLIWSAETKQ